MPTTDAGLQVQEQMDEVSKLKTYKGAIIALTGAVAVLLLLLAFGMGMDRAMLAAFVAWIVPTGVNAAKQFMRGVPVELLDAVTGKEGDGSGQ